MDRANDATPFRLGNAPGGRSARQRADTLLWVTLLFWGVNFGIAIMANVFGDVANLTLTLLMRSALYLLGLALCFALYQMQEGAGGSVLSRLRVLALVAPLAAGMCAYGSLAISQYVNGEIATVPEIVRTVARWLWFFVGWSAACLAVHSYFDAREIVRPRQVPSAQSHRGQAPETDGPRFQLWIGVEATKDVSREAMLAACDFSETFNAALTGRSWRSPLVSVDVLLVVMNAAIVPPLAECVTLKRELGALHCRVRLDFRQWMDSGRAARIELVKNAVSKAFDQIPPDLITAEERETLRMALGAAPSATHG